MTSTWDTHRAQSIVMAIVLALLSGIAHAATPAANEAELLQFGFKPLLATTKPKEYEAYLAVHPQQSKPGESEAATRAYRMKQDETMRKATARDLSDPFLGATWADLGW